LTRILQESLGGNSRTTLIINCSPSSYNEAESISTLRFGARAKTIKNKAKVNADLSPAELKALLKQVKGDTVSYKSYIAALENEIQMWRAGHAVPEASWASPDNKTINKQPALAKAIEEDIGRPATPAVGKDERNEFLIREQELLEQIAEKQAELVNRETQVNEVQTLLDTLKATEKTSGQDNKSLTAELNQVKLLLEKEAYAKKEGEINIDSLKEVNQEHTAELQELTATWTRLNGPIDESTDPAEAMHIKQELQTTNAQIEQHLITIQQLEHERDELDTKRQEMEDKVDKLTSDYEALLEKNMEQPLHDLQAKLESQFQLKHQMQQKEVEQLQDELQKKIAEEERLQHLLDQHAQPRREAIEQKERELERMRKSVAQELADFETMKKVLMRDLQARCERAVELEITLEETRLQQNNLIKATSNKAQQKKMALLERNLDQLTTVQKQVKKNTELCVYLYF
jgi:kinesin family protein 5